MTVLKDDEWCLFLPTDSILDPGSYHFPFTIPLTDFTPYSISTPHGIVGYHLTVRLSRTNNRVDYPLTIHPRYDLSKLSPRILQCEHVEQECFGLSRLIDQDHSVWITLNIDVRHSNTKVLLNCMIDNRTEIELLKCTFKLVRHESYRLTNGHEVKHVSTQVDSVSRDGLRAKAKVKFSNIILNSSTCTATCTNNKSCVHITYQVELKLVPKGPHFTRKYQYNVYIGS